MLLPSGAVIPRSSVPVAEHSLPAEIGAPLGNNGNPNKTIPQRSFIDKFFQYFRRIAQ